MAFIPGRCLLKIRLKEIKRSPSWLSEKTGISKTQISDYSTNRKMMSYKTAMTIAAAIDCYMEDLYERIGSADIE